MTEEYESATIATALSWDWKSRPSEKGLREALEPLGIHVTLDPVHEGSDQFGFIFSRRALTPAELEIIEGQEDRYVQVLPNPWDGA